MSTTNVHEQLARTRKAQSLFEVLDGRGIDAQAARRMPPRARKLAAQIAGVRAPSETTWRQVCTLLDRITMVRADRPADPFEGLS